MFLKKSLTTFISRCGARIFYALELQASPEFKGIKTNFAVVII